MQIVKNKTAAIAIAIILVTSMAISLNGLSVVSATGPYPIPGTPNDSYDTATYNAIQAGMHWTGMDANASATRILLWTRFGDQIPTHVYEIVAPNPVGVGQTFNVVMFNPQVPPGSLLVNSIRYQYTLKVTKPDGTTETLPAAGTSSGNVANGGAMNGVFISDSTGSTFTAYTPDQVGNYTLTVNFLQLQYLWNSTNQGGSNDYYGTTFKASNYTMTVTVQQEPVELIGLPDIPALPTQYWTRPIEGENTGWYQVASNWLSGPHDRDNGGAENRYQADGVAPNSPHILWTRPTEDNGVVGGNLSRAGNVFNAGSQYQPRFTNQIIMYGRLYYSPNVYSSGSSSLMDCVDLKTGQLIYEVDTKGGNVAGLLGVSTTSNMPQFGYYYSQDDPNEHGIQNPGWLFTSNYGIGFQPERGIPYLNILNVPSGFEIQAPAGENVRYVLTNIGTSSRPNYVLSQWNSSKVVPMIGAGSNPTNLALEGNVPLSPAPANTYWNGTSWALGVPTVSVFGTTYGPPAGSGLAGNSNPSYDWNISMPWNFTTSPTVKAAKLGDILWGYNASWPTGTSSPSYAFQDNITVWAVSLNPNSLGQPLYMKSISTDDATTNQNLIFERADAKTGVFIALWVPSCTFVCFDMHSGDQLWKGDAQADLLAYGYFTWPSLISQTQTKLAYGMLYTGGYTGSISAYNLTNGNLVWRQTTPSGGEKINDYVQMEALICDGKIYVGTHEHSADTPLYKGERVRCYNAYNGTEIWTMTGWAYPMTFATADGVLIYWNNYDAQIYAIGQGPTSMTVTAPDVGVTTSTPVTIRGTVMDISAGTTQSEQAADFPNGVPAVSDASMSQWMEYVYMQKAKPTNATGVPVSIDVIDSNGNYRNIGTATSDSSGMFTFAWTPDITGSYTVTATFAGSQSYYGSSAETSFYAGSPAPTASPYPTVNLPPTETYFAISTVAIIIAIAIVGILMLRKRP